MPLSQKTVKLAGITLALYLLLLFWIISLKCNMPIPISDTKLMNQGMTLSERFAKYLSKPTFFTDWKDAVVNIILMLPTGMLLPFLFRKHPYLFSCVTCVLISACFEIFQIISCIGGFTYIDIINNSLGGILGVLFHFLLRKIAKEKPLNLCFYFLICGISLTLVYATVNTIVHIDIYF